MTHLEVLAREEHAERLAQYAALIETQKLELLPLAAEKERLQLQHDALKRDLDGERQSIAALETERVALKERARLDAGRGPTWLILWLLSVWPLASEAYMAQGAVSLEWLRVLSVNTCLWQLAWVAGRLEVEWVCFLLAATVRPPEVLLSMLLAYRVWLGWMVGAK